MWLRTAFVTVYLSTIVLLVLLAPGIGMRKRILPARVSVVNESGEPLPSVIDSASMSMRSRYHHEGFTP